MMTNSQPRPSLHCVDGTVMSDPRPWEMLAEIEANLLNYLARTGSLDDGLLKALILAREITKDFEILVAKNELEEYQPTIN